LAIKPFKSFLKVSLFTPGHKSIEFIEFVEFVEFIEFVGLSYETLNFLPKEVRLVLNPERIFLHQKEELR